MTQGTWGVSIVLAALVALALAADARAQALITVTEDVVVTATVEPLGFDELARAVHVVLRTELERLGLPSVAEALRVVAGVDVRARGPRDVQSDFAVRGATFGQSLVLVDGVRLNDSQSGHHNGDIPIPVAGIDRIEVLTGSASAVHGADALGGAINVISRRDGHATVSAAAGQHGYAAAQGSVSGRFLPERWTLTGWGSRSSGFAFDRDFAIGGAAVRGAPIAGVRVDARHLRKAFGANGFYGNSPSKEWTDLTMAATSWQRTAGAWTTTARGAYRTHGDHFRWDIARPGVAENRHRTHAVAGTVLAARAVGDGRRLTVGGSGGSDAVASSNLGDHRYGHGAAFAELQARVAPRATVQAGLRLDGYSTFGSSWSPSVSAGVWVSPGLRLRASAARAFRIPTYTERYYRDPAHAATADLRPERGWSLDGGADWTRAGWLVSLSGFRRWDEDVIDWVKREPADLWNTTNVRDVTTTGVEASVARSWHDALVRVSVASLDVSAPSLDLLSKYVLEYARHSLVLAAAAPVGGGLHVAGTVEYRARFRGDAYALVGLRGSRTVGRATVFLQASNLFDETYVEIPGVEMPGRWVTVGISVR